MRVHDATSIEEARKANGEDGKKSKFLRICGLVYTIAGLGIIRWGDKCFMKITIVLRLIQMYCSYIMMSATFRITMGFVNLPNSDYPVLFAYSTTVIPVLTQYILVLQGFVRKNNIDRHNDDIERIDNKFPELSLARRSKVHCYMHTAGLVSIATMILIFIIMNAFDGDVKLTRLSSLWSKSLIIIAHVLSYNSVYDVHQRFKRINELCSVMGNQEVVPLEKIRLIRKLKIIHIQLSKHMLEIVKVHGVTAILTVIRIFTIFSVNFIIYINKSTVIADIKILLVLIMLEIIFFVLLCNECTNVEIEANATKHCVYGMALKDPAIGLRMEVLNFVSYLRIQKVQFKPYGCCEINNRFIVMIVTVLITHIAFFVDTNGL